MAGCCDCGNDPSDTIKYGELLESLRTCKLLRKTSAPWSELELTDE